MLEKIIDKFIKTIKNVPPPLLLTIMGLFLRLYRLDYQSFWTDEIFTYNDSNNSLNHILFSSDINTSIQPLYYSIIHFLTKFENQEIFLRLPSVIFGVLSIGLFYQIIKQWNGKNFAIIGAGLFTFSPFQIWYSQEARPYAMLMFLALLSIYFFNKLKQDRYNFYFRLGFILSTSSTVYCHSVGIAYITFILIYTYLFTPKHSWNDWFFLHVIIIFLICPSIYHMIKVPPEVRSSESWRTFNPLSIFYMIWVFGSGYSLGPSIGELHSRNILQTLLPYFKIITPIILLFSIFLILGFFKTHRNSKNNLWFLSSLYFFPLIFTILGSIFTANEFNVRYTILSFIPFIMFVTYGIFFLRLNWLRTISICIILLIFLISLNNYYYNGRYHKENNRAAGKYLSKFAYQNDLVICSAGYTERDLLHYYNGDKIITKQYPTKSLYVNPNQIENDFFNLINGREHFWLFLSRTFHSDPEGFIKIYISKYFEQKYKLKEIGVELILYKKK